ncbi:hypothetical protein O3W44_22310 [Pantoea sp. LMR881]|uniref:hypothetical protein n=1 Tax=Pantoea sp. LMR881 TaxID=3014336 RepID=UPI0022AEDC4C|nr:hypothetical protein [Pantoea sp. LMR881]MCZ4061267.1 hypothetical protein [Pantoea sp. LMR881]
MLDNDNQLAAYRQLNKTGFRPPDSVVLATSTSSQAKSLSAALAAVVLPSLTYPANIAPSVTKISDAIAVLDAVSAATNDFASYFVKFQSPSELLNVSIGWRCYLKGESLPDTQSPALVTAIADSVIVKAMADGLAIVSTADLITIMGEINTVLIASAAYAGGASQSGSGTAGAVATVSDDLASRLVTASLELKTRSKSLTEAKANLIKLSTSGKQSVDTAKKAFTNAVGISLLDSMKDNAAMGPAISSITPAAVTDALKGVS